MTEFASVSLPTAYHEQNRQLLLARLDEPSVAVLASGRAPHKSSDDDYPFWANRNFFYLTGLEQDDIVLLLIRQADMDRVILFIQEPDAMYERWRGHHMTIEEARLASGIEDIRYLDALKPFLADYLQTTDCRLWIDHCASDQQIVELKQWINGLDVQQTAQILDLEPMLTALRMIKHYDEIEMIKKAIQLTDEGIRAMLRRLEPGLKEYHLWAEFAHVLASSGCLEPAFPSIVASGDNLFCLHHMHPFGSIKSGDLVQIDVGARVAGLCADISRVFPASGRFSDNERALYAIVRQCQETAFATIRPGITLAEINEACRQTALEGLLDVGWIEKDEPVTRYFWHNVSHHLGLDVHDVSDREAKLLPGMVLTVEPGIYIPEKRMGMRIEDDVIVTETGCTILSNDIPREAEEIESLMR